MTKTFSIAAMFAVLATASFAGSPEPAYVEPQPDVFVAQPSSAGLGLPLAIAGGVAALALIASDSDDDVIATTTTSDDSDD